MPFSPLLHPDPHGHTYLLVYLIIFFCPFEVYVREEICHYLEVILNMIIGSTGY